MKKQKVKKSKSVLLAILVLGVDILVLTGCKSSSEHQRGGGTERVTQYYWPMHPEVVQNSPGKCPNCGMDLVEKH